MALFGIPSLALWIVVLSVLLLAPPFDKGVIVGDLEPQEPYEGRKLPLFYNSKKILVEDYFFPSHGENCHAWLYHLPEEEEENDEEEDEAVAKELPPVVVMAHGMGMQKDFGLDRYALKFVNEGFVVFMFDYRNFGPSSGQPRNWISPSRHIEDYHAALDFIESSSELKQKLQTSKIALWGTSYSGGHVLEVASQRPNDSNIIGVVSQIPHLSARIAAKKNIKQRGLIKIGRVVLATLQDLARTVVGLPPVSVKIIGTGDDVSIMNVPPDDLARNEKKRPVKKLGGWNNQTPARMLLEFRFYNPIDAVEKQQIKVPVLFIGASEDFLCPPDLIEKASSMVPPGSKFILREGTHFQIYEPEHYIAVAEEMANFYKSCLV